jgi:hypothetical protein
MKKLHAYIDGFNLYKGIMDPHNAMPGASFPPPVLRKFLWLDFHKYICSFFPSGYSLDRIHYFTAPIRDNTDSLRRQETFWKALESIPHLEIHKGVNARRLDKNGNVIGYSEKQSDVRLALQALEDALLMGDLDAMVFLCADADQVPTIERIQKLQKTLEIFLLYPPCRHSGDLSRLVPKPFKTRYTHLRDSQFPDLVQYERNGQLISVQRPIEWT